MEIISLGSGSTGNCYRVSDGHTALLLECGLPLREIRRGLDFKLTDVEGCLVSHEHLDHARSAPEIMKAGVDIYASTGTFDALSLFGHRAHVLDAPTRIGTWLVTPFAAEHDAAEPLGFVLDSGGERLMYSGDTCFIRPKIPGISHLMIEANHTWEAIRGSDLDRSVKNRTIKTHMSLETVKGFLAANDRSRLREVWLLHLSDRHSDEGEFRRQIQQMTGVPVIVATTSAETAHASARERPSPPLPVCSDQVPDVVVADDTAAFTPPDEDAPEIPW